MDVLPVNFRTLQILGLWHEESQRLWPLKLLHRSLIAFLVIHFTIFQLVTLVLVRDEGVEAFTGCLFMSFSYVAATYKLTYFVRDRANLDDLLDKLRLEVCRPRNPEESTIAEHHQALVNRLFIVRMITTFMSGFAFLSQSFFAGGEKQLPVKAYQMFNITGGLKFAAAYFLQFITVVCSIGIDVSLDAIACAFIILISGQLELLCHRIATTGGRNFKDYVLHHNLIFVITRKVKASFIHVILPAFCCALICLGSSTYQLAQAGNTMADFMGFILYIGCLLIQLYYYCWCGSELQLKSESVTNAIFRSDWTTLSPLERKCYWLIMFVGQKDLVISFHGQCALNLCTFIWMVKTSYGAYNLLQQVSD